MNRWSSICRSRSGQPWAQAFRGALPLLTCTSLFLLTMLIIAWCKVQLMLGSFLPIVDLQPGRAVEYGPKLSESLDGVPGGSAESLSPAPAKDGPLRFLLPSPECALLLLLNVPPGHATRTPFATRVKAELPTAEDVSEAPSSDTRLQDLVRSPPSDLTSNIPALPRMALPATGGAAWAVSVIASARNL